MAAKRTPCPHCGRSTAVVGKSGQLARHGCTDNPQTMTPVERVRSARTEVSSALGRRAYAVDRVQAAERALARNRVGRYVSGLALVFALVTAYARPGTYSFVGLGLAVLGMWLGLRARAYGLDLLAERRARVAAITAEHEGALATLLAVEAAVPDPIAHPELFPADMPDLDNLKEN